MLVGKWIHHFEQVLDFFFFKTEQLILQIPGDVGSVPVDADSFICWGLGSMFAK